MSRLELRSLDGLRKWSLLLRPARQLPNNDSMDPMTNDQGRLEPVSILVVEADLLRRRWIEHALSGRCYHVMTVASAKQGLHHLKQNRFDVVVMGGHLRAIEITEWLSEIRQLYPDLPVIVNQVKWPVGREYREGGPGGFQSLVRSLQTQDAALREGVERDNLPADTQERWRGLGALIVDRARHGISQ